MDHEVYALFPKLNQKHQDERVLNKRAFSQFCVQFKLSSPALMDFDHISNGVSQGYFIAKPETGSGGRGIVGIEVTDRNWKIEYQQARRVRTRKGADFNQLSVAIEHLCSPDHILQPAIQNHPQIQLKNNRSLVTLRIFTHRHREGVDVLDAVLFIPMPKHMSNNNGALAHVDLETGCVGPIYLRKPLQDPLPHEQLFARPGPVFVPYLEEAGELSRTAHQALNGYLLLAWDLAVSVDGPMLLEANTDFDIGGIQVATQKPLELLPLGKCLVDSIRGL